MLTQKKCTSCHGDAVALSPNHIEEMLTEVPGWELIVLAESPAIRRKFTFKNFAQSLDFVNRVGGLAEEEGHHPDISFGWGYAEVTLYTHAIPGLHENDFIMAAKINAL